MIKDLENRIASLQSQDGKTKSKRLGSTDFFIDTLSGLSVGAFLGYLVDSSLNCKPLFLFIMIVVGTSAGMYNFYKKL